MSSSFGHVVFGSRLNHVVAHLFALWHLQQCLLTTRQNWHQKSHSIVSTTVPLYVSEEKSAAPPAGSVDTDVEFSFDLGTRVKLLQSLY
jgi:hypothetical protein